VDDQSEQALDPEPHPIEVVALVGIG
jgi:hypothetical protein